MFLSNSIDEAKMRFVFTVFSFHSCSYKLVALLAGRAEKRLLTYRVPWTPCYSDCFVFYCL